MEQAASVQAAADRLREDFGFLDDWRDKVEHIIDLGKRLPGLPDELKTEGNKVRGCQSQVWLVAEMEPEVGPASPAGGQRRHPGARADRPPAGPL